MSTRSFDKAFRAALALVEGAKTMNGGKLTRQQLWELGTYLTVIKGRTVLPRGSRGVGFDRVCTMLNVTRVWANLLIVACNTFDRETFLMIGPTKACIVAAAPTAKRSQLLILAVAGISKRDLARRVR